MAAQGASSAQSAGVNPNFFPGGSPPPKTQNQSAGPTQLRPHLTAPGANPPPPGSAQSTQNPMYNQMRQRRYSTGGSIYGNNPSRGASAPPEFRGVNAPQGPEYERFNYGDFDTRRFEESSLAEAMRMLNPNFESQDAAFRQRMVNQGIAEGTEAYDNAYANMSRSQNDLRSKAAFDAMRYGQAAQAQDFGQRFSQNQFNNQLAGQEFANAMQRAGFDQSEAAREYGQQFGYDQLANQLAQTRIGANASVRSSQIGADAAMERAMLQDAFARTQLGENSRQFDINSDFRSGQADWQNLFNLGNLELGYRGMGLNEAQFNEMLRQQDFMNTQGLLSGLGGPNTNPLDTMGAYNLNYQGQMNNFNQQNQAAQQNRANFWNTASNVATSAIASSRDWKENGKPVDKQKVLEAVNSMPVEHWNYKGEDRQHIGPYAEDFAEQIGGDGRVIEMVDSIGALMASVQALTERIESLEAA